MNMASRSIQREGVRLLITIGLVICGASAAFANVRVCTYNLLHYESGAFAARDPNLKLILAAINPDVLCVQEISNTAAMQNLRDNVLNAVGGPGQSDPYVMATFSNTSDNLDIGLLFRSSKYSEYTPGYQMIVTSVAPRPAHRWRLRPVAEPSGNNDLYIYGMHLSATVESEQTAQAADVRTNANNLAAGSMIVYCGDFNLHNTGEGAYQRFTESQADNDGRAWDYINPTGGSQTWNDGFSYASIHTQSPYDDNPGQPGGAAGGGMDDRFDFLLISYALNDGMGQNYVPGSYKPFGNDGQHFNKDINDAPTIPEGAAMADALHSASDHLPTYIDLTDVLSQPVISTPPVLSFPQSLVGSQPTKSLTVTNSGASPGIPLDYSFTPPSGFLAPGGSFQLNSGANQMHTLTLTNTATSGTKNGVLAIANNSATNPKNVTLNAIVLDHAVPSVYPDSIATTALADFGEVTTNDAVQLEVTVFNATVPEYPSKVNLKIDSGSITDDASGRFSLVAFSPPILGITSSSNATVQFDAIGAAPGEYTAKLTFATADDNLAIGAGPLADIVIDLTAMIPTPQPLRGDFDGNFDVGLEDVDPFVAVLLDPENATPGDLWTADMTEDMTIDGNDLQPFVDAVLN